ncbi:MAG: RNA polymerase sigma factor, partial [Spirochaetes bacterium]|nr:RNA polymerase sigma factor [Spirochaetota bacterium]
MKPSAMNYFETMVRGTYGTIFSLSYRLTGSHDDAGDLTQETYLRALDKIGTLRDPGDALPWLRRICVNAFIDEYRRRRGRVKFVSMDFPSPDHEIAGTYPGPEEPLLAEEELRRVHSQCYTIITAFLPLYQRIVFVLAGVFGLPPREVSYITGKSDASVKSLLFRARRRVTAGVAGVCGIVCPGNP